MLAGSFHSRIKSTFLSFSRLPILYLYESSRIKSTFLSFSRLPILYHRRMEIPIISSFVLLQPNATHRCTMFSPFAKEKHCAKEKSAKMAVLYWRHRSLSPDSRRARFCIETELKFHVFVGLKRGEEKLIGNLFFRFSYENNMKIRSSK